MIGPLNLFFFLPITGIDITYYSQVVNFTCVIYPALDPLPNILIIDEYRKTFLSHFLFWRKNRIEPANLTNLDTNNKV
ncbi:unnamed protein product [Caenorhabditis angaria]|uniref:Serpentine receptor class gamma n=1 Tax=Caenorhabditis angaria TaxID=860376 RepID=A0A9P1IM29_9PELO|nr:unnamed protein product [Caenorhabditis angaria]